MAPEQYAGREADERTDQFAFCVALYEALYGKRPFRGDTLDTLREQVESGAVEVPLGRAAGVPSRVRRALLRGLSPNRGDRHPSLEALLGELKKALARRRRQAITVGAAAALGAGAFAMLISDGGSESSMCDASAHLAGVWDGEIEEALSASLARDPSAELAIAALTRYATEWEESYESVCLGAYEREDISEQDSLLAQRCLMDRRHDLSALVATLEEGGAGAAQRAASAAQALPPLGHCEDFESLRAGIAPPEDDEVRALVEAVREDLAALRALVEAGRAREADERVDDVVARAEDSGYAPLSAEAMYRKGEIKAAISAVGAARDALGEAAFLAEVEGYGPIQARALVGKLGLESRFSSDYTASLRLAERARAAVSRIGRDGRLEARLHRALARVYAELGRFDEAETALESALEGYRREDGARSVRAAQTLSELAALSSERGRFAGAAALSRQALGEARESLGARHPRALDIAADHAEHLQYAGRYREARELFDEVEARQVRASGSAELAGGRDSGADGARQLAGEVVDARGEPVEGAEVVAGDFIPGDGHFAFGYRAQWAEDVRRASSGDGGRFSLSELPPSAVVAIAEHDDRGRSMPARVFEGEDDEEDLVLVLEPFGRIEGEIRIEGEEPAGFIIVAVPEVGRDPHAQFAVYAEPGETFSFERLAAGPYTMFAMATTGSDGAEYVWDSEGASLYEEVLPGETTRVSFRLDRSGSELRAEVVDADGDHVPWARVGLYDDAGGSAPDRGDRMREATASPGKPAVITNVSPGQYGLCAEVSPVDRRDPEKRAALREIDADLPRVCEVIQAGPARDDADLTTLVIDPLPSLRDLRAAAAETPAPDDEETEAATPEDASSRP